MDVRREKADVKWVGFHPLVLPAQGPISTTILRNRQRHECIINGTKDATGNSWVSARYKMNGVPKPNKFL